MSVLLLVDSWFERSSIGDASGAPRADRLPSPVMFKTPNNMRDLLIDFTQNALNAMSEQESEQLFQFINKHRRHAHGITQGSLFTGMGHQERVNVVAQ